MINIVPLMVSFVSTFLFIAFCYKYALSIDLIDRPGHRKDHIGKIPLIGGIAVVFGFSLACLVSPRSLSKWRPFFFAVP
jgi:UDP-GlcNAc:undecaprenyl-phosphate/decaprenyl-phosphate GlcNAc-1-phosphate transferase